MESNVPTRINANVRNTGLITNLPDGSCVEVPCLVDNLGIHPCYVGDLPAQNQMAPGSMRCTTPVESRCICAPSNR